jgi:ABC-type glycerol-3-phosphate transport system substrate-binding protein
MPDNTVQGRLYSLPAFLQIEGMFYNPEVLAAAGVSGPQVGWTRDDLRALGRRARRMDAERRFEVWGVTAAHPFQFDWALIGQAGGFFLTDDLRLTPH